MKIVKPNMDLAQAKELEIAKAMVAKQQATIEYLAMMTDVDIPTEDSEVANDEQ